MFITRCRFAFPREVSKSGELNTVNQALKSKKIYLLSRSKNRTHINKYNLLLLLLWKANMDRQFTTEELLALAHYVTGYIQHVTKAESSNMQDIWKDAASGKSIYSRLFSFRSQIINPRECGWYGASDLLLDKQLCGKPGNVKCIDAAFPHKRKIRVQYQKKLEDLHSKNTSHQISLKTTS